MGIKSIGDEMVILCLWLLVFGVIPLGIDLLAVNGILPKALAIQEYLASMPSTLSVAIIVLWLGFLTFGWLPVEKARKRDLLVAKCAEESLDYML